MKNKIIYSPLLKGLLVVVLSATFALPVQTIVLASPNNMAAAATAADPTENPNSTEFKLVDCDGPTFPTNPDGSLTEIGVKLNTAWLAKNPGKTYKSCNFVGALQQIQHLMNIAVILGVLIAILLFSYAGYLMVSVSFTGKQDSIKQAREIFKKVAIGFIIMLVAWFVIFQILSWMTGNSSTATTLLN